MAFRIAPREAQPIIKGKPVKNADYLSFLHKLPCVVTGTYGIQAAHLSFAAPEYGHYGRAKGRKAPDRWALPLSEEQHRRQHSMNEAAYWDQVGEEPHKLALIIFGLFTDLGDEAEQYATAIIRQRILARRR